MQEAVYKLDQAREVFETDRHGQSVYVARAKRRYVNVECELKSDSFEVAFPIHGEMPSEKCPDDRDISFRLALAVMEVLPKYLGTLYLVDLFSVHEIHIDSFLSELPESTDHREYAKQGTCLLHDEVCEELVEQSEEYHALARQFEKAVGRLREYAGMQPSSMNSRSGDIYRTLGFVEDCLDAAELGFMHSWYQEKRARIRRGFGEMMKRKQTSHPGYQLAKSLVCDPLSSYKAPRCWNRRPRGILDLQLDGL